jgi:hypothetical protein
MNQEPQIVYFTSEVGDDQIIRPPAGISLPKGQVEVKVMENGTSPVAEKKGASFYTYLQRIIDETAKMEIDLPSDMAENHDHYAHGAPKR